MVDRWFMGWQTPLSGIALALALIFAPVPSAAQSEPSEMVEEGDCTPSREPHDCPDRCPTFDTCYIDEGDGLLYYRVGEQRFDCDGLDCTQASTTLADYCCQRGQFAPPSRGGGGCVIPDPSPARSYGSSGWSWLGVLGLMLAGRRLSALPSRPAPPSPVEGMAVGAPCD